MIFEYFPFCEPLLVNDGLAGVVLRKVIGQSKGRSLTCDVCPIEASTGPHCLRRFP